MIPRCRGIDLNRIAETEADHFGNCPMCSAFLDMRDLGQMLAHVHDLEIEICMGEDSPPREGPLH
jgi:hypothetical protein